MARESDEIRGLMSKALVAEMADLVKTTFPEMEKFFHSEAYDEFEALSKDALPLMEKLLVGIQDGFMRSNLPLTRKAAEALSWLSEYYLDGGEITIKRLAALFSSRDTLTRVLRQLLHLGFLEETGTQPSGRRGRPPKVYRFHRWPSERLHQVFADKEWSTAILADNVRSAVRRRPARVWNFESFHILEYHEDRVRFNPVNQVDEVADAILDIRDDYGSGEAFAASFAKTLELAVQQAKIMARLRGKDSLYVLGTHFHRWPEAPQP